MQQALFLALFVSMVYVQCLPNEATQEAEATADVKTTPEVDATTQLEAPEYKDFCDVGREDQMKFLSCVEANVTQFRQLLDQQDLTLTTLLEQICGSDEPDYPQYLKDGLMSEWVTIEECLQTIEGVTAA